LDPTGHVDPAFGEGGFVQSPIFGTSVVVDSTGRLVVLGAEIPAFQPVIARFEPDGRLDSSFGDMGLTPLPKTLPAGGTAPFAPSRIALGPDGSVAVAGYSVTYTFFGSKAELLELTPAGMIGPSVAFVADPRCGECNDYFFDVAVEPDGGIVALGSLIVRTLPDGSPNRSFGDGGLLDESGTALAVQPNGRIVLAVGLGSFKRLLPDATPDLAFGHASTVTTMFDLPPRPGSTLRLRLEPDGRILALGEQSIQDPTATVPTHYLTVLSRYFP
jgi:uncharacterized delta-60 repeat protein